MHFGFIDFDCPLALWGQKHARFGVYNAHLFLHLLEQVRRHSFLRYNHLFYLCVRFVLKVSLDLQKPSIRSFGKFLRLNVQFCTK